MKKKIETVESKEAKIKNLENEIEKLNQYISELKTSSFDLEINSYAKGYREGVLDIKNLIAKIIENDE